MYLCVSISILTSESEDGCAGGSFFAFSWPVLLWALAFTFFVPSVACFLSSFALDFFSFGSFLGTSTVFSCDKKCQVWLGHNFQIPSVIAKKLGCWL